MKARAIGATLIVPFGAGLLLWPYGTLLVTVLLIVLAAREGARIVGAISGGASAAWSAALLVVPFAAAAAFGPVVAAICGDRKSTRLNSSHIPLSRMPSSA